MTGRMKPSYRRCSEAGLNTMPTWSYWVKTLWYAWLEFTRGEGDRIWVGRDTDPPTEPTFAGHKGHGSYSNPTLTFDAHKQLWLSYEQERDDQWDLFVMRLVDGNPAGTPIRVSPASGADIRHTTATDGHGGVWFVWQSDHGGQFDILARRLDGSSESLGPVEIVSEQATRRLAPSCGRRWPRYDPSGVGCVRW